MEYRQLGKSGLSVSELSFGSWVTFGSDLDLSGARQCIHAAVDQGINFFDNAEVYGAGAAELIMGEILKDFKREDLVVSTKIFWGGKGPNQTGLSAKHVIEGTKASLRRLQLDYADIIFCHRADPKTPIEETVRAFDYLIRSGLILYWGTSEWKKSQIEEACEVALKMNATPPTAEQPEYNMFHRERVEKEYLSLYSQYGIGLTVWSPLDSGILTGKYNQGVPSDSRLAKHPELADRLNSKKIAKVKALESVSKDVGCTLAQLALAWCLKNNNVSTVITGATNQKQLVDNLQAIEVKHRLMEEEMERIDTILKND